MADIVEKTDIDLNHITFDLEYVYHKAVPALGSPVVVQEEPAHVELQTVKIEGATVLYHKPLWDRLSERIMEDLV